MCRGKWSEHRGERDSVTEMMQGGGEREREIGQGKAESKKKRTSRGTKNSNSHKQLHDQTCGTPITRTH